MAMTTENEILDFAQNNNIGDIYALTLFAQAIHETGKFSSNVFLNAMNSFGMRIAGKRAQNNIGVLETKQGKYAVYSSVADSWRDRINLDFFNKTAPPQEIADIPRYIQEVARKGYATDPAYVQKWLATTQKILISEGAPAGSVSSLRLSGLAKFGIMGAVVVAVLVYLIKSGKIKLPFKIPFLNS